MLDMGLAAVHFVRCPLPHQEYQDDVESNASSTSSLQYRQVSRNPGDINCVVGDPVVGAAVVGAVVVGDAVVGDAVVVVRV